MKALLVGDRADRLLPELEHAGIDVTEDPAQADVVFSYGGDGSLLGADRAYPLLPKVAIRRNSPYEKCPRHRTTDVLARLVNGTHDREYLPRIIAETAGRQFRALNDIVIHNANPASALRYRIWIDDEPYSSEIVGDGIVVATPFGSSAYYRSITNSVFRIGMGLAFNNSIESVTHLVLDVDSTVELEVCRGPAVVVADNFIDARHMAAGDRVRISMSEEMAEIWELGTLLCRECREKESGRHAGWRHV